MKIVSEYDGEAGWITVDQNSGDGDSNVAMKVAANESEDERSATIIVTSKGGEDSVKLLQRGKTVTPDPSPDPKPDPTPQVAGWMELPAVPEGTAFYTHPMTVGSVKTRNYSFIWDEKNLVAPWVAYPLCKSFIGSGGRTDQWALDPLLPEGKQPVLSFHSYRGAAGLVRGHQIPSADRLNYLANVMTFYGTNATPQIHSGFNEGIWENLEGKVRSWANSSDTLYVVTGCVIDYKDGETVKYALDNYGKKVTVPTSYYKVVLRYQTNPQIGYYGYSGYSACAVWMDHKVYSTKTVDSRYSMSVDDLEKRLGIDFFVNLPAKIGEDAAAKVEAEDPAKIAWWWRH